MSPVQRALLTPCAVVGGCAALVVYAGAYVVLRLRGELR